MKIFNEKSVLKYFSAPAGRELARWCSENNFNGIDPVNNKDQQILASALHYAGTRYPGAEKRDIASFAGLVSYLATGLYGGFGTEDYPPERRAKNILTAWAGGMAPQPDSVIAMAPSRELNEESTHDALRFLESYYFKDAEQAVTELIENVHYPTAARIILSLSENQNQYDNAIELLQSGDILTAAQVAQQYNIPRRTVLWACQNRLTDKEAFQTPEKLWIITRAGAERVFKFNE